MTTSTTTPRRDRFVRLAIFTTALTYFLISVGSMVRVSGAGMGCPDWPTCFGLLVPPMSAAELPDPSTYSYPPGYDIGSFDPVLTWIEFLNRLVGVAVGFAILATLIAAIVRARKTGEWRVLVPTFVAFVSVLYAGWLGGRVVAHELAPWMVTAHLVSAIVVVSALLIAVVNASTSQASSQSSSQTSAPRWLSPLVWAVAVGALLQGALGTQVRGTLDDIARHHPELARAARLDEVGPLDHWHRQAAVLVFIALVVVAALTRKHASPLAARFAVASLALGALQIGAGLVLAYAGLPQVIQVTHLLLGALLLAALTATALHARR
jgi:cytochrome c oxidase assembly protein subunit 15